MKKMMILGTLLLTGSLLISSLYYPNSPLLLVASTGVMFDVVRAITIVLLAVVLVSNPPRALMIRWALGVAAVGLMIMTLVMVGNYAMGFVDAVIFSEMALIFGIEALEDATLRRPMRLSSHQAAPAK